MTFVILQIVECSYTFLAVCRWSLGAIMYEMLVGYPPFYADDPLITCRKVRMQSCLAYSSQYYRSYSSIDLKPVIAYVVSAL